MTHFLLKIILLLGFCCNIGTSKIHFKKRSQKLAKVLSKASTSAAVEDVQAVEEKTTEQPEVQSSEMHPKANTEQATAARMVWDALSVSQRPHSCEDARFVLHKFAGPTGFGAEVARVVQALMVAHVSGRILSIDTSKNIVFGTMTPCPAESSMCVFQMLSNCTLVSAGQEQEQEREEKDVVLTVRDFKGQAKFKQARQFMQTIMLQDHANRALLVPHDMGQERGQIERKMQRKFLRVVLHSKFLEAKVEDKNLTFDEFVHRLTDNNPHLWIHSIVTAWVLRKHPEFEAHLQEKKTEIGFKSPISCIHIRHGDKIKEVEPIELDSYIEGLQTLLPVTPSDPISKPRVFIATDDKYVINNVTRFPEYDFVFTKVKRAEGSVKQGNGYGYSLLQRQGLETNNVAWSSVTSMLLLSQCENLVHTISSNFGRTAYELRYAANIMDVNQWGANTGAYAMETIAPDRKAGSMWTAWPCPGYPQCFSAILPENL